MTTPSIFAPLDADAHALLVEGVTAVKALVDALLGDVSAAIPKVTGDALVAGTTYLESTLPSNIAPFLTMILSAGESAAAPVLAALGVRGQVALALVQKNVDTFLSTIK